MGKIREVKNKVLTKFFNIFGILYCPMYDDVLEKVQKERGKGFILPENIYGSKDLTAEQHVAQQNRIHKIFKYMIMYPVAKLFSKVLGKYLISEIPDKKYYRNMRVFNEVYTETLQQWDRVINQIAGKEVPIWNKSCESWHIKSMLMMKDVCNTLVLNDSAYLNLVDMFILNLAKRVNDEYRNDDGKINHVLYSSKTVDDVRYFVIKGDLKPDIKQLLMQIMKSKKVTLQEVDADKNPFKEKNKDNESKNKL